MANQYKQSTATASQTRFTNAPMDELQFSRMVATPTELTTFNGGELVPIRCFEVLPHDTYSVDLNFVIRQTTVLTPTMGQLNVDFYAFFVPNRVVNESWKNVMGENTSGEWTAPAVSLVHLSNDAIKVPVGSVLDHYGYPTQGTIPAVLCQQMHDLKPRGYVSIYNNYFRDENWQPPIAFSKLNVYNGFCETDKTGYANYVVNEIDVADGAIGAGALVKAIAGEAGNVKGGPGAVADTSTSIAIKYSPFNALGDCLKVNKYHDYFTSVLPQPQRSAEVFLSASGELPVRTGVRNSDVTITDAAMTFEGASVSGGQIRPLAVNGNGKSLVAGSSEVGTGYSNYYIPNNLWADLENKALLSVSELRMSSAIQRVYETLARGGARYRSFINSFFGLDTENPFDDIPTCLGHIRRKLDLYQTAQTSASVEGENPQGHLAAFGYTANGGHLFERTFLEHGYVHIFAVVRHSNVYSSMLAKDNFRMSQLDFYVPQLANISEQPVYTYQINPFADDADGIFGYQESWAEYREEPNTVSGFMRSGIGSSSLSLWNYADDYDPLLVSANGEWLKSNTAQVIDRTLAVQSSLAPQFKGQFTFIIDKQRPMPVYSVPGADII